MSKTRTNEGASCSVGASNPTYLCLGHILSSRQCDYSTHGHAAYMRMFSGLKMSSSITPRYKIPDASSSGGVHTHGPNVTASLRIAVHVRAIRANVVGAQGGRPSFPATVFTSRSNDRRNSRRRRRSGRPAPTSKSSARSTSCSVDTTLSRTSRYLPQGAAMSGA